MAGVQMNAMGPTPLEWSISENRRESRMLCKGDVRFFLPGECMARHGELMDVSNCGFRAEHNELSMTPGLELEFVHQFFRGKARVMWSRVADGKMESGFLIIRD